MKTKTYRLSVQEKARMTDLLTDELKNRSEIAFAYVYGSFAENDDLPVHDIDIGVHVSGVSDSGATPYALELASALSQKAGMPVHVAVINYAPAPFLYHVVRGKAVFTRDDDLRSRVVEHAIRRYLDIKPLLRKGIKEAFAA
jgi:predicted nucleotidyltransferase